MCLYKITRPSDPSASGIGFKVLRWEKIVTTTGVVWAGVYYSLTPFYYPTTDELLKKQLKAQKGSLLSTYQSETYRPGFHIFKRLKDATSFQTSLACHNAVVFKVKWKYQIALGRGNGVLGNNDPVIVAKYMTVLHRIDNSRTKICGWWEDPGRISRKRA